MSDNLYWTAAFADATSLLQNNWRPQIKDVVFSSAARPSLASFQNKLWCVHRGGGSNQALWCETFDFNNGWYGEWQIPYSQQSPSGPALAEFNGNLYCVYQGDDDNIYCTISVDGSSWSNPTYNPIVNNFTQSSPALAVANNQLWCVYRGTDNKLYCIGTRDGQNWSNPKGMGDNLTSLGPTLAAFNSQLWCAYRGWNNNTLCITTSSDGQNWSNYAYIKDQYTDCEPALIYLPDQSIMLCVYGDGGGGSQLYCTINTSGDPINWQSPNAIGGVQRAPGTGVGLAQINGIVFSLYRG